MRFSLLRIDHPQRAWGHWLVLALSATVIGCGIGRPGTVSGHVTLDGKPLPGGTVSFRPVSGGTNTEVVELDESGSFTVQLPPGEVFVWVDNRHLEPRAPAANRKLPPKLQAIRDKNAKGAPQAAPPSMAPAAPMAAGKYVKIPDQYYLPDSSGLKFTVQSGDQTHDIPLASK
jgi:hypothetical protein